MCWYQCYLYWERAKTSSEAQSSARVKRTWESCHVHGALRGMDEGQVLSSSTYSKGQMGAPGTVSSDLSQENILTILTESVIWERGNHSKMRLHGNLFVTKLTFLPK